MDKVVAGIGGLLSDPACCVINNGAIRSAVEQAKVSRHDRLGEFPDEAFQIALDIAKLDARQIDCIALARPFTMASESAALLQLRARFPQAEIVVVEHHDAHGASAYYLSGFMDAAVLSIDRAGDFRSTVLFKGQGNRLTRVREMYFPDSFGDLFNRVTALLCFEPRADEHKVQWLSASGQPRYLDLFRNVLNRNEIGWPQTNRQYFDGDHLAGGGFSSTFYSALKTAGFEDLNNETKADIASSLQTAVIEAITAMLGDAREVAVAGGVAMNALLVRSLEQAFSKVFVQPASGNAGTALGAALCAWHSFYGEQDRIPFSTLYLGPSYSAPEIKEVLENCKLRFQYLLTEDELIARAIRALEDNKIVAWMQDRMEFGPRALGNRSILASPLNPYSTENLNVYIKRRESFRKFAASVPEELAETYFKVGPNARYLATVAEVRPEYHNVFAAAILAGNLIRVHTVRQSDNPLYHRLLHAAGVKTGLPVLFNTSFNLFGDPLVCTPRDAVRSFYSSGIDALFTGSFYLEK